MASKRDVRIGLACAGGVVEGAIYEIGALCALEEAIEGVDFNALDVYVGVSSGALITSLLANGVPPRALSRAILSQAEDETLNVSPEVLFTPALREYVRRLGRLPRALFDAARQFWSRPGDLPLLGALADLGPLMPVGIFDSEPLQRYLARAFGAGGRTNDFRALDPCLRVVAMRLDTAEVVVFGDEMSHVPISKAIQASTALPILYCPVEIEGRYYIDGVARRTVNASVALDAGAELLFCINPIVPVQALVEQRLDHAGSSLVEHGLPAVLSQTFRSIVYSRKQTGFRRYEHLYPDADIITIEPDFADQEMFFSNIFSFSNRHAVCEHAYHTTRQYLRQHAGRIAPVLQRHGLCLRTGVLDDPSRTLLGSLTPLSKRRAGEVVAGTHDVLDRLDFVLSRLESEEAARASAPED